MRKLILLPAALLAAALASTAVYAQGPGGGWHHHHGDAMMHELKELNLTDAQQASVKSLVQANHAQFKPQFEALMSQHQAFEAATPGTAAYENAAASLAQAASAAASAHVQAEAALRTQIYALLTDAQKAQLVTLQAQHQAKVAAWMASHSQPAD